MENGVLIPFPLSYLILWNKVLGLGIMNEETDVFDYLEHQKTCVISLQKGYE